jgi:hypothetical protein
VVVTDQQYGVQAAAGAVEAALRGAGGEAERQVLVPSPPIIKG